MPASLHNGGLWGWSGGRDIEGHRTYTVELHVKTDDDSEGPAVVMQCPGLAVPGSIWIVGSDTDIWAWATPQMEVEPIRKGEPGYFWKVTQHFTTKPPSADKSRPYDADPIEDPLLEPQRVSGSFIEKTEEGQYDRFGSPIATSSHEGIRGAQNEWPSDGGDTISVEQNVADLELGLLSLMKNWVNDAPLWGLPARCIRFKSYTWDKKYYGASSYYYTRRLEFEANRSGFDRVLLDEGTKVLNGHWDIQGSGCTLNLTTSGGAITSATVNAGGTGYSVSATVTLEVTGGGGTGGFVNVTTNSSGVVTGVSSVANGGTGYSNTTGAATRAEAQGWVVDPINGVTPDPNNPSHFIRYQDPNGNLARVILDGNGRPYDPNKATSFTDDGTITPSGTAIPGSNTAGISAPSNVQASLRLNGSLPNTLHEYKVTALKAGGETTGSATASATTSGDLNTVRLTWDPVTGATGYRVYVDILGTFYRIATVSADVSTPGQIYVQKFQEGDLLLLGIPAIF
jgi:hypothetical protein